MKVFEKEIANKKLIEILTIIIILVIILLVLTTGAGKGTGYTKVTSKINVLNSNKTSDYKGEIETELEDTLSKIKGVGDVKAMVTLETGDEMVPAVNQKQDNTTTSEKDKEGGDREITQKNNETDTVIVDKQGDNSPVVLKYIKPKVKGVIVVARGAGRPSVQLNISQAVQVALNIGPDRVQVFEMK